MKTAAYGIFYREVLQEFAYSREAAEQIVSDDYRGLLSDMSVRDLMVLEEEDIGYPDCDTCGKEMDYMPWHYSTTSERHLHACDECWPSVDPSVNRQKVEMAKNLLEEMVDDGTIRIRPSDREAAIDQLSYINELLSPEK